MRATVGVLIGSGGLGGFLLHVDKQERKYTRYDRLFEELIAFPNSREKQKAIIDLAKKMSS
ncbi:MAG TPA: hypothetical protein VNX70_19380 [Bryobacteraceae bacterium]|nr:hypothetical protein [Bryobacteraceae bacterium]